jgi:hypothetical protein
MRVDAAPRSGLAVKEMAMSGCCLAHPLTESRKSLYLFCLLQETVHKPLCSVLHANIIKEWRVLGEKEKKKTRHGKEFWTKVDLAKGEWCARFVCTVEPKREGTFQHNGKLQVNHPRMAAKYTSLSAQMSSTTRAVAQT